MPAPQVQFVFDFGSPNAYLAHRVIPSIEQRTGAIGGADRDGHRAKPWREDRAKRGGLLEDRAVDGLRAWGDYMTEIAQLLAAPPARPPVCAVTSGSSKVRLISDTSSQARLASR